ncbi:MAG: hypothetical protein ABSH41_30670, partial [Syntrophobacteraceae bacterium]
KRHWPGLTQPAADWTESSRLLDFFVKESRVMMTSLFRKLSSVPRVHAARKRHVPEDRNWQGLVFVVS